MTDYNLAYHVENAYVKHGNTTDSIKSVWSERPDLDIDSISTALEAIEYYIELSSQANAANLGGQVKQWA